MDQPLSPRAELRPNFQRLDALDDLVAWRAPEPRQPRFGAANDVDAPPAETEPAELPIEWRWGDPVSPHVIAVGGAVAAALLGAWLGSLMQM